MPSPTSVMRKRFAGHAGGLGQQRVGLAAHLLQQEVELLADFAALVEQPEEVLDVGFHAHQLLADVAALGQQRGFLQDAVAVGVGADQFLHAQLHFFQVGARDRGAMLADFLRRLEQALHVPAQLAVDALALFGAHGVQAR